MRSSITFAGLALASVLVLADPVRAARLTQAEKDAGLRAANDARCRVVPRAANMPALVWDASLESVAQDWADTCPTAHNTDFSAYTGPEPNVGENMAFGFADVEKAIVSGGSLAFENERLHYDLLTNSCASGKTCGHFTQLVWANTGKMGCARNTNPCSFTTIVCTFADAGNYVGQSPWTMGTLSDSNAACVGATHPTAFESKVTSSGEYQAFVNAGGFAANARDPNPGECAVQPDLAHCPRASSSSTGVGGSSSSTGVSGGGDGSSSSGVGGGDGDGSSSTGVGAGGDSSSSTGVLLPSSTGAHNSTNSTNSPSPTNTTQSTGAGKRSNNNNLNISAGVRSGPVWGWGRLLLAATGAVAALVV